MYGYRQLKWIIHGNVPVTGDQVHSPDILSGASKLHERWEAACNRPALEDIVAIENLKSAWDAEKCAAFYRFIAIKFALQIDSMRSMPADKVTSFAGREQCLANRLMDDPYTLDLLLLSTELIGEVVNEPVPQPPTSPEDSILSNAFQNRRGNKKLTYFLTLLTDAVIDSVRLGRSAHTVKARTQE